MIATGPRLPLGGFTAVARHNGEFMLRRRYGAWDPSFPVGAVSGCRARSWQRLVACTALVSSFCRTMQACHERPLNAPCLSTAVWASQRRRIAKSCCITALAEGAVSTALGLPGIPQQPKMSWCIAIFSSQCDLSTLRQHVSTAEAVDLVRRAKAQGVNNGGSLSASLYAHGRGGPPLRHEHQGESARTAQDVVAVRAGLCDGRSM
jgi:hypothetical protein